MALGLNASSYALANYTSSTTGSKTTASLNASTYALSNYTKSASPSSGSKPTSTSASSNALANYTSLTSSPATNKTISAEAWNASATPSTPAPSKVTPSKVTSSKTTPSKAAPTTTAVNASTNALANYTRAAATASKPASSPSKSSPATPNASTNALSNYLGSVAKGSASTAAKSANFAVPVVVGGTTGAAAEATGIDLLAALSRSLGGSFTGLGALAGGFVLLSTTPAGAGEDELVRQLGLGNTIPAEKKDEQGKSAPSDAPPKVVPNPYGKKGGPAHQAGVKTAEAELKTKYANDPSVKVDTEIKVDTPAGEKKSRYLDVGVVGGEPKRVVEGVQVGRATKSGIPIARERRALDDLGNAIPWAKLRFRDFGMR